MIYPRAISSVVAVALLAATAHATLVNLSGDLGNNFWNGGGFSPIASAPVVTPFAQTFANGTISGNALASNPTGFALSLKLTNITYTTFTPGVGGLTDILLVATHGFQIAAGTFFANHNLTGTWSTATGNIAQLNTTVDINSANPSMIQQIILINTAATTSFVSSSPAVGGGTTSPVMTIQMALRLRIDGVGTTILPGSADVDVTLVPAPAAAALLPLVGLLAARRRR